MSVSALDTSLQNLQTASTQLIQGRVTQRAEAISRAQELALAAEKYFASICKQPDTKNLRHALQNETIQYPVLCAPEQQLVTKDQFKKMHPELRKFFPNNTLASYLCQVFKAVVENDTAEKKLKSRLIQGKEISLIHFASFKPTGIDRYWETRYQALKALSTFIEHPDYGPASQQTIVKRMTTKKEHPHVKAIAREIVTNNADKQYQAWQSTFQTIRQETQQGIRGAVSLEAIQQELIAIQDKIAELSSKLTQVQTGRQQQSASGEQQAPEEITQELLQQRKLEEERKNYEEWLLEQDYALETLQLFEAHGPIQEEE